MKKLIGILLILLISTQLVFAGIVSGKELKGLIKSGDVVIVSARSAADYGKKHITGAVNIYHKDLYKKDGIAAMLKTPDEIAKIFGEKGITENSKIVIYDDGKGKFSGRLFWIFKYLGATDVNILDGHLKGWGKVRGKVTPKATEVTAAAFTATPNPAIIADMAYVTANKDNAVLVDARSADEFGGKDDDEKVVRPGHIPGAVNFEFKMILNEDGTIKAKEEIAEIVKTAGITADKEIILYCASSVRAGIVFMALTDLLEFPNVKIYDGAYYEWSASSNPIK